MLAYTAYVWLLHNARLSLVTTYAYVNPLVAVALGALLLDERLSPRTAVATVCIVGGVILMVSRPTTPEPPATTAPEPAARSRENAPTP
jgi:drug/metabolite transporter (DMT)-like permease